MKKVNVYVDGSVRWAAYKKDDEYQAWIDYAVANNLWGIVGSYTVEVVDATVELEEKRLQAEATKKTDFDSHITNFNSLSSNFNSHSSDLDNPHQVTKAQLGLGNVDDVSASSLRDRSTHTGSQLAATISDFNEAAQDAVGNALLDSANINFTYPDVSNQITADLSDTGVVAGTYSLVSVDSKGRVTVGSNTGSITKYSYSTSAPTNSASATYASIAELTSAVLPIGLYRISFVGKIRSTQTTTGMGFRIAAGTAVVGDVGVKWEIAQGANGVSHDYSYDQISTADNITTASIQSANTDYMARGDGYVRITTTGTVAVQFRAENTAGTVTLGTNAIFRLELV